MLQLRHPNYASFEGVARSLRAAEEAELRSRERLARSFESEDKVSQLLSDSHETLARSPDLLARIDEQSA